MCGVVAGGLSLEGIDVAKETVIQGVVSRAGRPIGGAYVRLLDKAGEFVICDEPRGAGRCGGRLLRVQPEDDRRVPPDLHPDPASSRSECSGGRRTPA